MQLVNSWLRDKDIRVVLQSVVEESSIAYINLSHAVSDILCHLIQEVPEARGELYSDGFRFLVRIGRPGMEGICVEDGRRVFDFMGPEHECMVCLDTAPCSDHIFCAGACTFWCCRSCFQKFQMRPRVCPTCKVVFPADMLADVLEENIVEEAHLISEALSLDSLQMEKYTQLLEFAEDTGNLEEVIEAYGKF